MTFDEYLADKKIDATRFQQAEPLLYENWKVEFEQMHHNSFTAQKLYLINPLRRKYILKQETIKVVPEVKVEEKVITEPAINQDKTGDVRTATPAEGETKPSTESNPVNTNNKPARPVFKPKPKIN